MKTTDRKSLVFLLLFSILLQNCMVYEKSGVSGVSLVDAALAKARTKVVSRDGETQKFKYVVFEEDEFYGVKKVSGKLVKTKLDKTDLKAVYTIDKPASILSTLSPFYLMLASLQ